MAGTLSQFIGEIRQRRDQELAQKLQAIVPYMQYEVAKQREQKEYNERLDKYRGDLRQQITNPDLQAAWDQQAPTIQTTEGLQGLFGQTMTRQKTIDYGSGLSKIYQEAWKDEPEIYNRLVDSLPSMQSPEEINAMATTLGEKVNQSRQNRSLLAMADESLDEQQLAELRGKLDATQDPIAKKALIDQSLSGADLKRLSKMMAQRYLSEGAPREFVASFMEQAEQAKSPAELTEIAKAFDTDETRRRSVTDYTNLLNIVDSSGSAARKFADYAGSMNSQNAIDQAFKYLSGEVEQAKGFTRSDADKMAQSKLRASFYSQYEKLVASDEYRDKPMAAFTEIAHRQDMADRPPSGSGGGGSEKPEKLDEQYRVRRGKVLSDANYVYRYAEGQQWAYRIPARVGSDGRLYYAGEGGYELNPYDYIEIKDKSKAEQTAISKASRGVNDQQMAVWNGSAVVEQQKPDAPKQNDMSRYDKYKVK